MFTIKAHWVSPTEVMTDAGDKLSVTYNLFLFGFVYGAWYYLLINDGVIIKAVADSWVEK